MLNIYTIALLVISPFWAGGLLSSKHGLTALVLFILCGGMIALSLIEKPLLAYDEAKKAFVSPSGETLALDQIDTIEMDVRDIYFIPKSQNDKGWHLSQRGWVLCPRRVLFALAQEHNWPLKDISHPISRFGFWLAP